MYVKLLFHNAQAVHECDSVRISSLDGQLGFEPRVELYKGGKSVVKLYDVPKAGQYTDDNGEIKEEYRVEMFLMNDNGKTIDKFILDAM